MSFFKALRGKTSPGKPKKSKVEATAIEVPKAPVYEDPWEKTVVNPEEIEELILGCTREIKSRGLTSPFFLLPYRPSTDPVSGRALIRKYFGSKNDFEGPLRGDRLSRELQLTDLNALCNIIKWCWARIPGGVVSWDTYELFRVGEADSEMSRNAFATFIPMSVEGSSRSEIIFAFFDLLSAIAANAKNNGMTGLKISRLAGWWAFEHSDNGFGFEGGYSSWMRSAEATCHLFFAYLRSLAPSGKGTGVSVLPLSLQQLLYDTEYPPTAAIFLQEPTSRIIMTVDTVSPTPFALLRRVRGFDYSDENDGLQEFSEYDDPVQALTDESKRILKCISSSNQSQKPGAAAGLGDQSWSRFQDLGFSVLDDSEGSGDDDSIFGSTGQSLKKRRETTKPIQKQKHTDLARPTTPSWADFMASGFTESTSEARSPPPLLLSPDKLLPQIETSRARSVQSNRRPDETQLEPGELASITILPLDDAFWMVWMTSLAPEETAARKAVFGRVAMFDTVIRGLKWVIVEEKVKGALKTSNDDEVFLASKKDRKKTMRGRLTRRRSVDKREPVAAPKPNGVSTASLTKRTQSISTEQQNNIRATAATLRQRGSELPAARPRPNPPERPAEKVMTTTSIMTLQPTIMKEISPAMTWAKNYDKAAVRDAYLQGASSMTSINASQKSLPPAPVEVADVHHYTAYPPPAQIPDHRETPPPQSPPKTQAIVTPPPPAPVPVSEPEEVIKQEPKQEEPVSQASLDIVSNKPQPPAPVEPEPEQHEEPAPLAPVVSKVHVPERATSPEQDETEPNKKVSKLRKLFGGGKATNRRASVQAPPPKSFPVPEPQSERRPSLGTKTGPTKVANGNSVVPIAEPSPAFDAMQPTRESPPVTPKPIATRETTPAASIVEEANATKEFSRFDQGPLDVPAFVPDDESPEPSPIRPSHSQYSFEPSRHDIPDVPAAENRYDVSPPSEPADEAVSAERIPTPKANEQASPALEPVVQDRWAQIKANAAARAKLSPAPGSSPNNPAPAPGDGEESPSNQPQPSQTDKMLEARLEQAQILKKVVEAIKDLVQDCNFDCNDGGIQLQAMDNSHVALVSMNLRSDGFSPYRCDRNIALGINLNSLMKVLRAAANEDILTLKAEDQPDSLNLTFESSAADRMSEYDIKLMDIDQEHLGIPETDYAANISLPSAEFQRICRDLSALSESVSIEATKEGVKFACSGDIGNGSVTLRPHTNMEDESKSTKIDLTEPVNLTFSLKYLVNFCKASSLSNTVSLCLSNEVPLLVEYKMEAGYLRFYLAPKIGDEE